MPEHVRDAARTRARRHRAEGLPRLLPHRVRHRARGAQPRHPLPGSRLGRELRGLLRARHHRGRLDLLRPAVRAVPLRACATRSPTSTSTSTPTGARRSSSTSTSKYGRQQRRAGRERHQLPAEGARCATWRRRSATPPGQQDAWSRQVERWGAVVSDRRPRHPRARRRARRAAAHLPAAPRHPLRRHGAHRSARSARSCPIEHARMENRTVLQWDKDDCAWMGLVKFDLLGLGMLAALQYTFDLIREHTGEEWELATHPEGGGGRLRHALPRRLDRRVPGREPGADGHAPPAAAAPLLRPRRRDRAHPSRADAGRRGASRTSAGAPARSPSATCIPKLEPVLDRTLGVPLFQEQLMQMARRRRRLQRRRRRPAATRDGLQARRREDRAAALEALRGHGRERHRATTSPTRSTRRSRPSRTSASPRATP